MNKNNDEERQIIVIWRRLKRNRLAVVGLITILLIILIAIFGSIIAPYDPMKLNFRSINEGISTSHLLGTDQVGRDIFSRILHGARFTLLIAFSAVLIGLFIGSLIGMIGGYYGGKVDLLVVFLTDILLAFPGLLLAIAIVAAIGAGITGVILASGFSSIPQFIRITRGVVLLEKEKDYVMAAHGIGESNTAIMWRYILPNCIPPIVIITTLRMAVVILITAGLSFLGLGAPPPLPEWGAMLSDGRGYLVTAPHLTIFPGLAIMILVLAFNLFGDGLRDALDPRMKL